MKLENLQLELTRIARSLNGHDGKETITFVIDLDVNGEVSINLAKKVYDTRFPPS